MPRQARSAPPILWRRRSRPDAPFLLAASLRWLHPRAQPCCQQPAHLAPSWRGLGASVGTGDRLRPAAEAARLID
jgi:hypothetical protein